MRSLFLLFFRNGGFVTFVLVEAFCFYLIVSFNTVQGAVWANTSMLAGANILEQRRKLTRYLDLRAENDSLQWENAALRTELLNRQLMQVVLPDTFYTVRMDTFQNKVSRPEFQVIPARVIGNSVSGASNWILLNRGTKDGVEPSSGVIARDGIVGIVRYVDREYSLAMSVLNRQTRISAMTRGQLGSLSWLGNDPTVMTLSDIPKDVQPAVGDSVITSNASLMFPANHLIGRVTEVTLPEGSNFYALKVKLNHNMAQSDAVFVVKNRFQNLIDSLQVRTRDE